MLVNVAKTYLAHCFKAGFITPRSAVRSRPTLPMFSRTYGKPRACRFSFVTLCHVKFQLLHFHVGLWLLQLGSLPPLCALRLPSHACNASPSECQTNRR